MTLDEQKSILAIALFAAFADGVKDDREREEVRRIADALAATAGAPDLARLYQDVLLKRITIEAAAAGLSDPDHRQLAYEMAVCVCESDDHLTAPEARFLDTLRPLLGLDAGEARQIQREVEQLGALNDDAAPATVAAAASATAAPAAAAARPAPADLAIDKSILNYAQINGALELLPQSWASMAIIPLQIKMVYSIGKAHGVELDRGHIKEFIAAAGVGLTSQYLEQFGRKLLGGLLGKAAGKTFGKIGQAATGVAFSFATTYALGHLAKRYYAGGRNMDSAVLRDTYQNLLGPAKQLQTQYLPQIRQTASSLDAGQIMALVRS